MTSLLKGFLILLLLLVDLQDFQFQTMTTSRRLSVSVTGSWKNAYVPTNPSEDDVKQWLNAWQDVFARGMHLSNDSSYPSLNVTIDLIDCRIVSVDSETSVEEACDVRALQNITCGIILDYDNSYFSQRMFRV